MVYTAIFYSNTNDHFIQQNKEQDSGVSLFHPVPDVCWYMLNTWFSKQKGGVDL